MPSLQGNDDAGLGYGVEGTSPGATGVVGRSDSGIGVQAIGSSGTGLKAESNTGIAVVAKSNVGTGVYVETSGQLAVQALSTNIDNGIGVAGSGVYGVHATGSHTAIFATGRRYGLWCRARTESGVEASTETGAYGIVGKAATSGPKRGTGVLGYSIDGGRGVVGTDYVIAGPNPYQTPDVSAGVVGYSVKGFGVHATSEQGVAIQAHSKNNVGLRVEGATKSFEAVGDATIMGSLNVFDSFYADAIGCLGLSNFGDTLLAGDVVVTGSLRVGGTKAFVIDHPLDPSGKLLQHACVESDALRTLYDGSVRLDENGEATVQLPSWCEALCGDFRYQLTAVGCASPNLHVAETVRDGRFRIAGGAPSATICWQVTAIRHDPSARRNPLVVEQQKGADEENAFVDPSAYPNARAESLFKARMEKHRSLSPPSRFPKAD